MMATCSPCATTQVDAVQGGPLAGARGRVPRRRQFELEPAMSWRTGHYFSRPALRAAVSMPL